MPMQAMMQRETNHQLLYQGGSTFNVKRNWGVVSFPSCVLQLTMMDNFPEQEMGSSIQGCSLRF